MVSRLSLALAVCLLAATAENPTAQSGQAPTPQPPAAQSSSPGEVTQQPGPPAQAQQQPPTFRTGVRLVRVDVTAVGRSEEPVSDLKASDFEVAEDGVLQRVEQMQFVRLEGQPAPGDERSLEIRSQEQAEAEASREDVRIIAIFLDDYHIDRLPPVTIPLRKALKEFVSQLWPTDLVVLMDPLTPLSALRFTRNKSELIGVIDQFEGRQGQIFPVKSAIEEAQIGRPDVARVRAEVSLSALAALVVRLGGLREGRKAILYVSQGPPTLFRGTSSLQDRMREISLAANRGNVTIYPYDPRTLGMTEGVGFRDTLFQLAAETGGRAITDTNDAAAGLNRILRDTSAYYVLGYTPTRAEDDGKYHKISVRVKRPGVHVLARQGYWAPAVRDVEAAREAAAKALDPEVVRYRATVARLEPTRHPAEVWIGWSPGEQGQVRVTIAWEPAASPKAGMPASTLDVGVFDAQGRAEVAPVQSLGTKGAEHTPAVFELKPGRASLRFTGRAADGAELDQWSEEINVPDTARARVILSSARFYRARTILELRAIQSSPDRTPDVGRRFGRGDRVLVAADCRVAPGQGDPSVEAHLLTTDGRELAALAVPPIDARGMIRFELPLGSLGQGTYLLQLRARVQEAGAEQLEPFAIVR